MDTQSDDEEQCDQETYLADMRKLSSDWMSTNDDINRLKGVIKEARLEIKPHTEALKCRTAELKNLESQLMDKMNEGGFTFCRLGATGKSLVLTQTITRGRPTKDDYRTGINEFLQENKVNATYEDVMLFVASTQEMVHKNVLKLK